MQWRLTEQSICSLRLAFNVIHLTQAKTEGPKHVLLIPKVMLADTGVFTCRANNPAGVAECSAELYVEGTCDGRQARVTQTEGVQ